MRPLRVLVTACGAPGTAALVRALRANGERDIWLTGCDMNERAIGRQLCDAFQQVPPGESPFFAENVLQLCRRERIDAVLPQSSHELLGLARASAAFVDAGITVLVSSAEAIETTHDKAVCYVRLDEAGIRVPLWRRVRGGRELARAAAELGYPHEPVCLKPVASSGSRGFRVLDQEADRHRQLLHGRPGNLTMHLEEVTELLPEVGGDELLVMELVEGDERTIDGIAEHGRVLLGQPKTRQAVGAGLARRVVDILELDHFFNVQLVGDVVVEVNPRISTIVYQEDINLPYLGLKRALGEIDADELAVYARRLRPTRKALRFYDQVEWDE
jgi:PylC-like, N-terminal domain/ATP-grasp in the biosynthetic pathway with Ter operon